MSHTSFVGELKYARYVEFLLARFTICKFRVARDFLHFYDVVALEFSSQLLHKKTARKL